MSASPTKYGVSLVVRGADATPENFIRIAESAESLGFDSLWLSAHIVLPPQVRSGYGLNAGVPHPPHWKECYWEPFTVMSYLAGHTRRITLGTSVLVLPMHNPFEVAKMSAEVDALSGGRFILGIGVGWFEEEFEVLGQNYRNRGKRTDDALRLMRALWSADPVSYEGEFYNVKDACFGPKPVQSPHPPIWVAGGGEIALRRTAEFGAAFHPVRPSMDFMRWAMKGLEEQMSQRGRSMDELEIAVKLPLVFEETAAPDFVTKGSPASIADGIKSYRDTGANHFVFDFVPETCDVALDTMKRFADEVRPLLD